MRIVHVYNWLHARNGGTPRVIRGLCAEMQRMGHEIRLVTSDRRGAHEVDAFLGEHLRPLPRRWVARPRFFLPIATRFALTEALAGADVAHLHGLWPTAPTVASQICRQRKVPYVFAPHDCLHGSALSHRPLRKIAGRHLLGWGRCVARADALHLLNQDEARAATWRLPRRVEVIPNGVFPEAFGRPPVSFRATLPRLGEAPYVLFLSRLLASKGCDRLIRAFAWLARAKPRVQLVVAGPNAGQRAVVERLVGEAGLGERVHFVGMLDGARKLAALHEAAVYCLPSRHEGFSIGILEAMACARPVVVTRECHFPQVADARCGLVVERGDHPAELGAALSRVLADPAASEAMGRRGRALVRQDFTWARAAERMVDLYRSIIRQR